MCIVKDTKYIYVPVRPSHVSPVCLLSSRSRRQCPFQCPTFQVVRNITGPWQYQPSLSLLVIRRWKTSFLCNNNILEHSPPHQHQDPIAELCFTGTPSEIFSSSLMKQQKDARQDPIWLNNNKPETRHLSFSRMSYILSTLTRF